MSVSDIHTHQYWYVRMYMAQIQDDTCRVAQLCAVQFTLFRARVPEVPRSTAACVVGHTDTSTIGTWWVADNCMREGNSIA